ncbi:hypothetical protein AYO41_04850, partial [Verrucomicrobia bacterium SCGC AG-212-E04]
MPVAGALHDFPLTDVVNAVRFSVGRLVFSRVPSLGQFELDLQEGTVRACRVGPDHDRISELPKIVDKLVLVNLGRTGDFAFNPLPPPSLEQLCNFTLDAILLEVVSRSDEIRGSTHLFPPPQRKFRRTLVEAGELDRDLRLFLRQTSAMLRRDASAEEMAASTGSAVQQVQLYLLKLEEFGMVEPANPDEADEEAAVNAELPPLPQEAAGPAKWFYLDRDKEIGPVAVEVIQHRISTGQMQPSSMVWRPGLSRWTSFEDVQSADSADAARRGPATAAVKVGKTGRIGTRPSDDTGGLARCHVCLKHFPREQMMYYQDRWICQTCRPDFFRNLSQLGVHFRAVRRAVGRLPWRFCAWLIDALLYGLFAKATWILLAKAGVIESGYFFEPRYLLAEFLGAIVWWTAFVWIGGTTPGKWALHLRVVTAADDERAGRGASFKRACSSFIPFGFLVAC